MQKTPLTIIAILIILAVTGTIFYLNPKRTGINKIATNSPAPSTQTGSSDNDSILLRVSDFYRQYQSCLKNPPPEAAGKVSVYCRENNPDISTNFAKNLQGGMVASPGADPVVCAQNLPQKINVEKVDTQNDTATAMVTENYGSNDVIATMNLTKTGDQWWVDNIDCPKP